MRTLTWIPTISMLVVGPWSTLLLWWPHRSTQHAMAIADVVTIAVVKVPREPRVGLEVCLTMAPCDTMVRRIVEPLSLPMELFRTKWNLLNETIQNSFIYVAHVQAHNMLHKHASACNGPAILCQPTVELANDTKYALQLHLRAMPEEPDICGCH